VQLPASTEEVAIIFLGKDNIGGLGNLSACGSQIGYSADVQTCPQMSNIFDHPHKPLIPTSIPTTEDLGKRSVQLPPEISSVFSPQPSGPGVSSVFSPQPTGPGVSSVFSPQPIGPGVSSVFSSQGGSTAAKRVTINIMPDYFFFDSDSEDEANNNRPIFDITHIRSGESPSIDAQSKADGTDRIQKIEVVASNDDQKPPPPMKRCYTGTDLNFVRAWTEPWDTSEFSFKFESHLLPDVAALALSLTPRGTIAQANKLHLYTDGTGGKSDDADSQPAFAVVIIAEVDNNTRYIVGTVADKLANAGDFVAGNQKGTNNVAEIAGLAYAIAIALAAPPHLEVAITSDSKLALHLAESVDTSKKLKQSQSIVEPLWRALSANRKATLSHIPSHIGHPWNEMADGVAHSASLGKNPTHPPKQVQIVCSQ